MEPFLRMGSSGPEVVNLQKALNLAGNSAFPELVEDGLFGPKTRGRVVEFQGRNHLAADGVVGPETRKVLQEFFDKVKEFVDKIVPPETEAAARRRILNLAEQNVQNLGWRASDTLWTDLRIAANLCANPATRARQGGLPLSAIFTTAGVVTPPPLACLTITPKAEANYRAGAPGRNQWDIPSWCGIFALHVYKTAGLKLSSWPLRFQGFSKDPEFRPITTAKDLKPGDLGLFDFRPNHTNHHFIVADVRGDSITTIEGNVTLTFGTEKYQTIVKRNYYRVSQILNDPFSSFASPIWAKVL